MKRLSIIGMIIPNAVVMKRRKNKKISPLQVIKRVCEITFQIIATVAGTTTAIAETSACAAVETAAATTSDAAAATTATAAAEEGRS